MSAFGLGYSATRLLASGRVGADRGSDQAPAQRGALGIDSQPLLVDRDVVVEPAQGGQVLRIMAPAIGSVNDVVRFETVA